MLWNLDTRALMKNAIFKKELFKSKIEVFHSIVCPKNLDLSVILSLDHRMKIFKSLSDF